MKEMTIGYMLIFGTGLVAGVTLKYIHSQWYNNSNHKSSIQHIFHRNHKTKPPFQTKHDHIFFATQPQKLFIVIQEDYVDRV